MPNSTIENKKNGDTAEKIELEEEVGKLKQEVDDLKKIITGPQEALKQEATKTPERTRPQRKTETIEQKERANFDNLLKKASTEVQRELELTKNLDEDTRKARGAIRAFIFVDNNSKDNIGTRTISSYQQYTPIQFIDKNTVKLEGKNGHDLTLKINTQSLDDIKKLVKVGNIINRLRYEEVIKRNDIKYERDRHGGAFVADRFLNDIKIIRGDVLRELGVNPKDLAGYLRERSYGEKQKLINNRGSRNEKYTYTSSLN